MNNTEKFNDTVGILVKAYLNDTLAKGHCAACAVGNIVAAANGHAVIKRPIGYDWGNRRKGEQYAWYWNEVFTTGRFSTQQSQSAHNYKGQAKEAIDATGYKWEELAKVEFAFETAVRGGYHDSPDAEEGMRAGLMAVVDVLADIHGIDLSTAEAAKALFVKA